MIHATAPGKLILCGEHAVVYGHPAIALPVAALAATATVSAGQEPGIVVTMPQLGEQWQVSAPPQVNTQSQHPLAALIGRTLTILGADPAPSLAITLTSTIPIASGMGSGAALGAALVRALAGYLGATLDAATISTLVYESERFYHGTPSGIDNTVVSFERAIWYQRSTDGAPATIEPIHIHVPLTLIVGDTGVRCPTRITVGGVRERFNADPALYNMHFAAIGQTVTAIRTALDDGNLIELGALLNQNHRLLQTIGVSSVELDRLVDAAQTAGALGAKLSGGGGGGVMLALTTAEAASAVATAVQTAGAVRIIPVSVPDTSGKHVLV